MACGHTIHYGRRHELESNQVHQVNQVKPIAFVYDHAPSGTLVSTTSLRSSGSSTTVAQVFSSLKTPNSSLGVGIHVGTE